MLQFVYEPCAHTPIVSPKDLPADTDKIGVNDIRRAVFLTSTSLQIDSPGERTAATLRRPRNRSLCVASAGRGQLQRRVMRG